MANEREILKRQIRTAIEDAGVSTAGAYRRGRKEGPLASIFMGVAIACLIASAVTIALAITGAVHAAWPAGLLVAALAFVWLGRRSSRRQVDLYAESRAWHMWRELVERDMALHTSDPKYDYAAASTWWEGRGVESQLILHGAWGKLPEANEVVYGPVELEARAMQKALQRWLAKRSVP